MTYFLQEDQHTQTRPQLKLPLILGPFFQTTMETLIAMKALVFSHKNYSWNNLNFVSVVAMNLSYIRVSRVGTEAQQFYQLF